jgi:hypothetical protein
MPRIVLACAGLVLLGLTGCATYVTPGAGANLRDIGVEAPAAAVALDEQRARQTDFSVQEKFDRRPLASFPATLAAVRLQGSGYSSYSARGYGGGPFTVVLTRTVETEEHVKSISSLPRVAGVAMLNRLVMPAKLQSEKDLRDAAASVQADMLFVYTFDTVFDTGTTIPALGTITLGLFPNEKANVTTTCSAALIDTRNGYVYALAEATQATSTLANAWTSREAMDNARTSTEQAAFGRLIAQMPGLWANVLSRYDRGGAATPAALR